MLAILVVTACATGAMVEPNGAYRVDGPNEGEPCFTALDAHGCETQSFHYLGQGPRSGHGSAPAIGYVEFDDQGAMLDRKRSLAVLQKVRSIAKGGKTTIVVFAHGWKHNARYDDENVAKFQELLARTHILVNGGQPAAGERQAVVGIYLGWRGMSARWEPMKSLSFWGRKKVSAKIGIDGLTEVVSELSELREEDPNVSLVLSGHSFGGQMMFLATRQLLLRELVYQQHSPSRSSRCNGLAGEHKTGVRLCSTLADFVFVVNPAIETLRYETLHDRASMLAFDKDQAPVFAVFMSEADSATKTLFPLGRWFSTIFESYREVPVPANASTPELVSQQDLDRVALGHHATSITHTLRRITSRSRRQSVGDTVDPVDACFAWGRYLRSNENTWVAGGLELGRVEGANIDPHSPYMVVKVDRGLIKGHGDIWGEEFTAFLSSMVRATPLKLECMPLHTASLG